MRVLSILLTTPEEAYLRVEEVGVDPDTLARLRSRDEGGKNGALEVKPSCEVGDGDSNFDGATIGFARDVHETRLGFD